MKSALITGITGQDGSYLAELLLEKGYRVYGTVRRSSTSGGLQRIEHIRDKISVMYADLTDSSSLVNAVLKSNPDEVYNLAAQSHVRHSFDVPQYTVDTDATGVLSLLEAVRQYKPTARFYQASSSEMFGSTPAPQSEETVFHPRSPYGAAKAAAHWYAINYRESYGMHVSCGILFNHESPRRGEEFVTRKITKAVGRIRRGDQQVLALGNLDAKRDWGFAKEYVEDMWRMVQQYSGDDYVLATGETHTVEEFVARAFTRAGLDWRDHVTVDPTFYRPAEVNVLQGDSSKARRFLGWKPTMQFHALVDMMVDADVQR